MFTRPERNGRQPRYRKRLTLRTAKSRVNCPVCAAGIYNSSFRRTKGMQQRGGKNSRRTSKCGLYRSNRSQTAGVRTFKNDLIRPGLACTGLTEGWARGVVPRKATCCTPVTHDALVRSSSPEHLPLSLPLPVFIAPNPFSVTFRVTICHRIPLCRFFLSLSIHAGKHEYSITLGVEQNAAEGVYIV